MTKNELETKREELNGRLDELFMLWQIAGDDSIPANRQYNLLQIAELKKNQADELLSGLIRDAMKEYQTRINHVYENRNAQIGT